VSGQRSTRTFDLVCDQQINGQIVDPGGPALFVPEPGFEASFLSGLLAPRSGGAADSNQPQQRGQLYRLAA